MRIFNTKKIAGLSLALLATVSSQVSEKTTKRTIKSKKRTSNHAALKDIVNEGQYHRKNQITSRCTQVTFSTRNTKGAVSPGPFFVDGYGTLPVSCHNEQGAECTISLCDVDSIKIRAQTTNAWGFFLSGDDVGGLIDYENTVRGRKYRYASFPVYTDTNHFAIMLRYRRKSMSCSGKTTTLTFTTDTTNENAASNGRFFVGGYGVLPESCHNKLGAQCDIEICNDMVHMEDGITIHAQTEDPWLFTVTGDDLGELVEYRTAPDGTDVGSAFPTWMDTVQFNYMQRYSLLPSQCKGISNTLTFNTNGSQNSQSRGPFFIDGYGTIPSGCHESSSSSCTIELCDAKDLTIRAQTTDAWVFAITGDIAEFVKNEVAFTERARHKAPFPTGMDTNDFDIVQKYNIVHHKSAAPSIIPSISRTPTTTPTSSNIPTLPSSRDAINLPSKYPSSSTLLYTEHKISVGANLASQPKVITLPFSNMLVLPMPINKTFPGSFAVSVQGCTLIVSRFVTKQREDGSRYDERVGWPTDFKLLAIEVDDPSDWTLTRVGTTGLSVPIPGSAVTIVKELPSENMNVLPYMAQRRNSNFPYTYDVDIVGSTLTATLTDDSNCNCQYVTSLKYYISPFDTQSPNSENRKYCPS